MTAQAAKASPERDTPSKNWPLDKLESYIRDGFAKARELEAKSNQIGHRSVVHLFRVGKALSLVRMVLKEDGEWRRWQEEHGFSIGTVNEAIRLYERAGREKALKGLGITEAKIKFGIIRAKDLKDGDGRKKAGTVGDRRRFVIPQPRQGNEFKVLSKTLEVFEQVLAAAKEAVINADGDSQAELDAMRAEFERVVQEGTALFKRPASKGGKVHEAAANGR